MIYALRHYTLPLFMALALHTVIAWWAYSGWQQSDTTERLVRPEIVKSKLLVLEPKAKPKAAPKPKPKPMLSQPIAEPVKAEPKPDPREAQREAERKREEAERKAERARSERLAALASQAFDDALAEEQDALAQQTFEEDAVEAAQSFQMGIYQKIVQNWSRPPSARTGMEAELRVELVPTGEVVNVTVVRSSGNGAFDRSAESAVRKSRRFEVPEESAIFERYFRRFTLLFKPEDLLR